jgi:hypothetical protein
MEIREVAVVPLLAAHATARFAFHAGGSGQ